MKFMKIKYFKGFTLVELIIVITILVILATIAFISFNGYAKSSRDTSRITVLNSIEKGLQVFQITTGKYPIPDDFIKILDGGVLIGYQGVIGKNVSSNINISPAPNDPFDKKNYVYASNEQGKKYQIMTFLESQNTQTLLNGASAYSITRIPISRGDYLGIVLDDQNAPINTDIDIQLPYSQTYNLYLGNTLKTGTGVIFTILESSYTKMWKDIDPNCNQNDIAIGGKIWAGCNSTLGTGVEWGKNPDGTNATVSCNAFSSGLTNSGSCPVGNSTNAMYSSAQEKNWSIASNNNNTQNAIWGKLYLWNNASSACPIGWHVATDQDFQLLEQSLGCSPAELSRVDSWQCNGLGWMNNSIKNIDNNIVQALKIPLAGRKELSGFSNRGYMAYFWTSTVFDISNAYARFFAADYPTVYRNYRAKTLLLSVRCVKD